MTEYSLFWTTSGNGDGVVTGYSPEQFWRLFRALFGGDGVALDYGSELETTLAGGVATVAAGAALVAGVPYTNDDDVDITIADPTSQNRYDRIVLRASWPAQTVRAVQLAGTEGSAALPVLTQTLGGIYEVEVARVVVGAERVLSADLTVSTTLLVETLEVGDGYALEVAAGGVVTLEDTSITDARTFLQAAAPGSATKIVTSYFGNEVTADLNGDGRKDVAFIITQTTGGSGTFYYAVAALNTPDGWMGSDGYLLGDRIAPQATILSPNPKQKGVVVFNFAERAPGEPMTAQPSVGKSVYLKLDPASMQWGIVEPNFEGESR